MSKSNTPQINVLEYDESIASTEQIASIYLANHVSTHNLGTVASIHFSQQAKYGYFVYLIYCVIIIMKYVLFRTLLTQLIEPSNLIELVSMITAFWTFYLVYYLIAYKNARIHCNYGEKSYSDLIKTTIQKKYMTNDDSRFWVATISEENKPKHEVIGTFGFIGYREDPLNKEVPDDKKFVAFVAAAVKTALGDDSPISLAYFEKIGLSEKYRGLGISKKLMERAIGYVRERGFKYAALGTLEMNLPMANLAKKFGFKIVSYYQYTSCMGVGMRGHLMIMKL